MKFLDIDNIKRHVKKTKFVSIGYITEYPEVTIVYIRSFYTVANNFKVIQIEAKTLDRVFKQLKMYFLKKYNLNLYLTTHGDETNNELMVTDTKGLHI